MSIEKSIRNGIISSPRLNGYETNAVSGAAPIATQWSKDAARMYETVGYFANNVFKAQIQGMDYNNFYNWKNVLLRSSIVIDVSTGDALSAGWQEILIIDKHFEFIPLGAFVKFNKATWIVVNTNSATMDSPTSIVQRCNEIYNTYDYYGNIVSVPYVLSNGKVLASSSFYTKYTPEIDGYAHIIMQLNKYTKNIGNTSRILIGKSAYNVFGVVDSVMEFSDIPDTCHIIKADIRLTDVLPTDDLETGIADGKSFDMYIKVEGNTEMTEGSTKTIVAKTYKNDAVLEPTDEYPLTYLWYTSDDTIATVDQFGNVTAVSEGECDITAVLKENSTYSDTIKINVTEASTEDCVLFDSPVQDEARAFENFSVSASFYSSGVKTQDTVSFKFSGASENSYTTTFNNNTVTISVWKSDSVPLTITAYKGDNSTSASIKLLGI